MDLEESEQRNWPTIEDVMRTVHLEIVVCEASGHCVFNRSGKRKKKVQKLKR